MTAQYMILEQRINTKSAAKGTYFAVRVDSCGDHTTVKLGCTKDEAYATAQADATKLGLCGCYIIKGAK